MASEKNGAEKAQRTRDEAVAAADVGRVQCPQCRNWFSGKLHFSVTEVVKTEGAEAQKFDCCRRCAQGFAVGGWKVVDGGGNPPPVAKCRCGNLLDATCFDAAGKWLVRPCRKCRDKQHAANTAGARKSEATGGNGRGTGTVKWFSEDKGYGFISCDGGGDVHVHYSAIGGVGFRTLQEGQEVTFELSQGRRGPRAVSVRLVPNEKALDAAGKLLSAIDEATGWLDRRGAGRFVPDWAIHAREDAETAFMAGQLDGRNFFDPARRVLAAFKRANAEAVLAGVAEGPTSPKVRRLVSEAKALLAKNPWKALRCALEAEKAQRQLTAKLGSPEPTSVAAQVGAEVVPDGRCASGCRLVVPPHRVAERGRMAKRSHCDGATAAAERTLSRCRDDGEGGYIYAAPKPAVAAESASDDAETSSVGEVAKGVETELRKLTETCEAENVSDFADGAIDAWVGALAFVESDPKRTLAQLEMCRGLMAEVQDLLDGPQSEVPAKRETGRPAVDGSGRRPRGKGRQVAFRPKDYGVVIVGAAAQ